MSKKYVCEFCNKVFLQKNDLTRHLNKKNGCIPVEKLKQMAVSKSSKIENKHGLSSLFSYCLDVLRNIEHLTGDKALRTLAHLLDLRLLESQFGKTINIDDFNYDFSAYEGNIIEDHKNKLLEMVRFSNLSKEKEENIPVIMKCLWDEILSVHPITKNIFLKGRGFDIQHQSTFKKLITKLNEFNFESIDEDILGEVYEEVIKDVMTGKVLGQFFTPPIVKKLMIKLIDPKLNEDGKIETIFDPAMGTGGFLISSLRHILKQSKEMDVDIDWNFLKKYGLGGREAEPDTYQLAISNMLISSGHMFECLEKGDSIRDPIENKYDIIIANPPFGIDGLTYSEIKSELRNSYMPIRSNAAVPLFLQAIIHMLKVNGRCALVLPDGKELFSRSHELINIRKYLMKTCDLKEIIYLPAGIFSHTSIKTCILYFIKKESEIKVLETSIKYSKTTKKEKDRIYNFCKGHKTNKVKFYDYNTENEEKHLLTEVDVENICYKDYSLNYLEYLKDENEEDNKYGNDIIVKNLEDVCTYEIGGTPSRSKEEYYENGENLWVSVRELNGGYIYDTKEKINDLGVKKSNVKLMDVGTILFSFKLSIGKTAIVGKPLYTNEAIAGIKSKNKYILDDKYLYYYLSKTDFKKVGSGMLGNGSLNKKSLGKLRIPIPSLVKQREIVKFLKEIDEKNKKLLKEIDENKYKAELFMEKNLKSNIDEDKSDSDEEYISSVI